VSLAQRGCAEILGAVGALEWPDADVDVHVSREGAVGGEVGLTDVTAVLLDARVGAHVGLEDPRGHEHAPTLATLKRLLTWRQKWIQGSYSK
jgi:hypothetical protein